MTQKFKSSLFRCLMARILICFHLENDQNLQIILKLLRDTNTNNILHTSFYHIIIFIFRYEGCRMSDDNPILKCSELGLLGIPRWFLYITPFVKFLQIFNAAINFPIYYFMGTSFRDTFHAMIKVKGNYAHNGNGAVTGVR